MSTKRAIVQNGGQQEQIQTTDSLDVGNANADGAQISGGVISRILKWLGADITLTGSGTNTQTMPSSSQNLVGRDEVVILTGKTVTGLKLTAGTASVAPQNIAAGTLKASPASGDVEFDGALAYFTATNGMRRKLAIIDFAFTSLFNVTITSLTLVDITGLTLGLAANVTYKFKCVLQSASDTTAGNKFGVNFSVAGATIAAGHQGTTSAGATRSEAIQSFNTAGSAYDTAVNNPSLQVIEGIINVGVNAGNLTIQAEKVTSGNCTIYAGAYLEVFKIS